MTIVDVIPDKSPEQPDIGLEPEINKKRQSTVKVHPGYGMKLQNIGSIALRGGLIGAIIICTLLTLTMVSLPFDNGDTDPLQNYLIMIGLFVGGLGLIIFTLIFYLGLIITFINKIRQIEFSYTHITQYFPNKKIFVIVSLIVSNFALSFIPQVFLFPFYGQLLLFGGMSSFAFPLDLGSELDQFFLIEIIQGILEHPDLEPGLIGRLIRLIAICILIYTIFSLIWTLIVVTKDFKHINEKSTFGEKTLELCFNLGILSLLIAEIIRPIWEFVDPVGFSKLWWSSFLIVVFIVVPLSILFLIFLITGNFEHGYFVIGNSKNKSRLLLSILFTLVILGYSWLLVFPPF